MTKDRVWQLIRDASENNVTKLDLSRNQLTQLPSEIGKLRNLTELSLSHNQLTQIPSEIVELKDLIELDLSWNQLTQLHPEVLKLKNLTCLLYTSPSPRDGL